MSGRRHRSYASHGNNDFIDALRAVLGLDPLPMRGAVAADLQHGEHPVSEPTLRGFDGPEREPEAPELIPDLITGAERKEWDERPRIELGGWFKEQRRMGIGITKGKPKPRYEPSGTSSRRVRATP